MKKTSRWGGWVLGVGATLGFVLVALLAPGQVGAQVNLWQGTAGYTIPIVAPPGTSGVGPSLALVYSSDERNGWTGDGWGLTGLGSIERLGPTYSPAPTYTSSDTYRLNLGGSHKLVYAGTDPTGAIGNYYRTEIESFLRIEYVSASNYWVVTDKGGTKFYFGQADATRQNNPGDTTKVFRWQLDKVLDPHGTFLTVSYDKDTTNGDMYPQQIVYTQGPGLACTPTTLTTCRTVDLLTEARPESLTSYRTGAKIVSDRRLQAIEVKMGGQLVRKYTLTYTQSPAMARGYASVSQPTSLTETGADGTTSLPPTTFAYNVDANGSSLTLTATSMTGSPAQNLERCVHMVDVNGDGLADILVSTDNPGNYTYYPHLGGGFGAAQIISSPGTPFPSLCNTTTETRREVRISKKESIFTKIFAVFYTVVSALLANPAAALIGISLFDVSDPLTVQYEVMVPIHNSAMVDLDGDGLPDVIDGATASAWGWWRNLGNDQFADRTPLGNSPPATLNHKGLRFADMDSDGLTDVVLIEGSGSSSKMRESACS